MYDSLPGVGSSCVYDTFRSPIPCFFSVQRYVWSSAGAVWYDTGFHQVLPHFPVGRYIQSFVVDNKWCYFVYSPASGRWDGLSSVAAAPDNQPAVVSYLFPILGRRSARDFTIGVARHGGRLPLSALFSFRQAAGKFSCIACGAGYASRF